MEWFAPVRLFLLGISDQLFWLIPALTALAVLALFICRRQAGVRPPLLVLTFGLAVWGQVFVGRQMWLVGGILYGAAALFLALWLLVLNGDRYAGTAVANAEPSARIEPTGFDLPQSPRLRWQVELALVALVVLTAAFARFYRFDRVPYGIEGDESKWSVKIAADVLAGKDYFDSPYTRQYLPYSYWTQSFFFRLMGVSTRTARWQVAFASLIATLLFYLLARKLLGPPGALLAAFLMAISLIDVSASRLSHVESHIKLPEILSFLFLVYAVDSQRWHWYLLTGLAVTLGLLSYDTFFLVPAVVGLWLGWRLLLDRRVKWMPAPGDWLGKPGRLLLFLAPITLVARDSWHYISTRSGYHNSIGTSLGKGAARNWDQLWGHLADNLSQTLSNFSTQRWGDFLYNRDGPIFNALLIPVAAIGFVYLIIRWRRGQNALVPFWFTATFFLVPVVMGSPYIRVFYPAVPAFYLAAAAALTLLAHSLYHAVGHRVRISLAVLAICSLALVGLVNMYIYLHEVKDFPERIARRQLVDAFSATLKPGQMVFVPYMPRYDDLAEWEREYLQFTSWGVAPINREGEYYQLLPYADLLRALSESAKTAEGAAVLYDHGNNTLPAERAHIIDAVLRCYPGAKVERVERIDAITIPRTGLQNATCTASVTVTLEAPAEVEANRSLVLGWKTDPPGVATSARLEMARQLPGTVWLEAEDLFSGAGWYVEGRFAPDFGGRGYLADVFQAPDITAQVQLPAPGRYVAWVRTHRRVTSEMPLTISVGGASFQAAQHNPEEFDRWRWERLGEVYAESASIPITLHRDYTGERHMSVFIDALAFSQDPGFDSERGQWPVVLQSSALPAADGQIYVVPPGRRPADLTPAEGAQRFPVKLIVGDRAIDALLWVDDPAFDITSQDEWRVLSETPRTASVEASLAPGNYRWRIQVLDGDRIVGPTGEIGQWSDWAYLTVK